jgi:SAM-dependent methyltransferase
MDHERHILHSWQRNADAWTQIVRSGGIESRKRVTNDALLDTVMQSGVRQFLDVGCGEGWLVRALGGRGIRGVGVDAVPALIEAALALGGGEFHVCSYGDVIDGTARRALNGAVFEAAVCNFSLLGDASVEQLLAALPRYLSGRRLAVIQTLHPVAACGAAEYRDGWRGGSWAGFGAQFSEPAPWYFRTLESWLALLRRCGYGLIECREPTAPGASLPASVILVAAWRGGDGTTP